MELDLNDQLALQSVVDSLANRLDGLVICLSDSWGGLEKVAAQDALDVGGLGLKMRVLCLHGSPIHQYLAKKTEVQLLSLPFKPRNFFDLKFRGVLSEHLSEGSNLIHIHQPSLLGSIVPWLWRRPHIALLATRHIMNNHDKRDFFHRSIYSRLDSLIVMSQTLRKNVLETHAVSEKKMKVVNLGLDFHLYEPSRVNPERQRAAWGVRPETIVVGLVGRIDPAKGQATFIKAAAGLLKGLKKKEDLKFVIIGQETLGGEGGYLEELKGMVAQFRLENHVLFSGFQENIPEVMSGLDIFVMPSRQEAFGLVAIEAMAMECPVIVSQGGSAEEIVGENSEFGLTMRPDDAFDLQIQIRYLLDHPGERVEMGKRAREHVRKNYDHKVRILKTVKLYQKALRRRRIL